MVEMGERMVGVGPSGQGRAHAQQARRKDFFKNIYNKCFPSDSVPTQIKPYLYVGGLGCAFNQVELHRLNVTHIVSLSCSEEPFPGEFKHLRIDVPDTEEANLSTRWDDAFAMIDEARNQGTAALVHCVAGRSRSVTVVLAYLMDRCHMRLNEALRSVVMVRPEAHPNDGFLNQLKALDRRLHPADAKT